MRPDISPAPPISSARITFRILVNKLGRTFGVTRTSHLNREKFTKSATYLRDSPHAFLMWNSDKSGVEPSYSTYPPSLRLRILSAQF